MMKWKKKHTIYLLFAYIVVQFLWWEILLVKLTHQNIEKEKHLNALKITDSKRFQEIEQKLQQIQRAKIIMIVGEGTVFLILILFGFYRLIKSLEREIVMSERQTHFLLSLPHEMKTPLSVIQLNLQTILNMDIHDTQKNILIRKSIDELKRLHHLIEQLLISNKITSGKYHIIKEPIELSKYIHEWILPYIEQKNIYTQIEDSIYIEGDKTLIELMIHNMIDNAIKFSEKYVAVKLYKQHSQIILEIINDGELIEDEERDRIFEVFYRKKSAEEKGIKGTGLGLYIVQQIAQMHQFTIKVYIQNQYNVFQVVF